MTNFEDLNTKAQELMIQAYYMGGTDDVDTAEADIHHATVFKLVKLGWLEITEEETRSVVITPDGETAVLLAHAVVPVQYDEDKHLEAAALFEGVWTENPTMTLDDYLLKVAYMLDTLIEGWLLDGYDRDQIAGYEQAITYQDFNGSVTQYLGELPAEPHPMFREDYPSINTKAETSWEDTGFSPASPNAYQDEVQTLLSEDVSPADVRDIIDTPQCLCGCGSIVIKGRQFLQGHDARLKSLLLAIGRGERPESDIPAIARGSDFVAKWGVPAGSLPSRKEQRRKANSDIRNQKAKAEQKAKQVKARADDKASHKPTGVKFTPLAKPHRPPKVTGKDAGKFMSTALQILADGITITPKQDDAE